MSHEHIRYDQVQHCDYYRVDLSDGRSFLLVISQLEHGRYTWFCTREDHPERDGVTSAFAITSRDPNLEWSTSPFHLNGKISADTPDEVAQTLELRLASMPYEVSHPKQPSHIADLLQGQGDLLNKYRGVMGEEGMTEEGATKREFEEEYRKVADEIHGRQNPDK